MHPAADIEKLELATPARLADVQISPAATGHIVLSTVTDAFSAVGQPALAINRSGMVLETNAAAEEVFDAEFCVCNRQLKICDPDARHDFHVLIARLATTPDAAALLAEPIVVRRTRKAPLVIRSWPIPGPARNPFLGARALLTLTVVEPKPVSDAAMLSKIFGLTRTEAKLAAIIGQGASPEHAAERLNVSTGTVRTHLKVVFVKTNTHRQGELVALLSRL